MRLTFLFKIAEGLVPAIPPDLYLTPMRQKRHIKPRVFTDCETTNIVNKYVRNNTRPFIIPQSSTNTYTHSFFIRTIVEWNSLNNKLTKFTYRQYRQRCPFQGSSLSSGLLCRTAVTSWRVVSIRSTLVVICVVC